MQRDEHGRRTWIEGRIWGAAVLAAAIVDLAFGWRQLWLQPRLDSHTLNGWQALALDWLSPAGLVAAAYVLRRIAVPSGPDPWAFQVRRGRFVVPAIPGFRASVIAVALGLWGAVPVMTRSWEILFPGSSARPITVIGVLLALAATIVAVRAWQRKVLLTPEGLDVHEVWDTVNEVPWDRAHPGFLAGRPALRWVDDTFLVRAIEHYHDVPEHRAAIGTREEHLRLTALLRPPAPAAAGS